jgi:CRISPR/Cas system-associated exonuclease Cas4 (RecB family)
MQTVHLPVLKDYYTEKTHISFSELSTWVVCCFKHKLKYLDKIDLSKENEYLLIGSIIHDGLESFFKEKKMPNIKELVEAFQTSLKNNGIEVKKQEFEDTIEPILNAVPKFLDEKFKNWEFVAAEDNLYENLNKDDKYFKGFIDCIIKVPKSSRLKKAKPDEFEYYILDWKVCSWGWTFDKKIDPNKTRQLAFYKHFYSQKYKIPLKDIKCGFVLLKRTPNKKTPNDRCEFVPVSIGEKRIQESLNLINSMLNSIKKNLFPKNRSDCSYCEYKNTTYCP